MKGEIQALLLGKGAGERIVAPGGEIGAGIGEVDAKQSRHRRDRAGQIQISSLVGRIHAVAPAAELRISET
jgi:hypothetical protein